MMKSNLKKIGSYFLGTIYCLLIFVAVFIAATLLPIKNNFKIYSVMSGSMEPTINTGSLIVVKSQSSYKERDIISFQSDEQLASKNTTTHRIVSQKDSNGIKYFATKGDANDSADPKQIPEYRIIGKALFSIPLLGYLISYIKTLPGLMLLIIIPAVIIVYEEIKKIHHEAKMIINKRQERRSAVSKKSKDNSEGAEPKQIKLAGEKK